MFGYFHCSLLGPPVTPMLVPVPCHFGNSCVIAQKVRVEQELEAYPTESVDLRCEFVDGGSLTKLTQVSWIWEPVDGQRDNIAVYHPIYGQSFPNMAFRDRVVFLHNDLKIPSIRINDLRMSDAGRYTCEYATYPSGNEQGTTTLIMLAKPKNSARAVTVQAGSKSVVVAQCEGADGKPAATIKWLASVGGNHSTTTTNGPDGTVTVRSEYRLVPTVADNGREVTCLVDQRTQDRPWTEVLKLSVEYPPIVTIDGYDNNWYVGRSDAVLFCLAKANPEPTTITWTTASGSLPDTVVVEHNKLTVRKVDDAVNTTFTCEVKNKHGASRKTLTTFVIEALEDPSSAGTVAGAVIGSLLALLLVVTLIVVLLTRSRRQQRRGFPSGGDSVTAGNGGSNGSDYGNKARLLFAGSGNGSKNGSGANNGPVYTYREGCDATGTLTEKPNSYHHHLHHSAGNRPTAHDILLCGEMDEAERSKFNLDDSIEEEDQQYNRFGGGGNVLPPAYHAHRGHDGEAEMDVYLDDDMESQRDGSVISRTAIYV
ncbi:PVR cell adhesion molecule related 2 like isoform X3 [Girardinichthys multiradiatus]|uniref:PVR cell adhesion molecule related 2 like isoform X3 n=1 Tax=Girardinichthys multiradiatus TaxID=208333 RepID=UPI001FACEDBF|nr:PVR cell adhesion molecule related 2 like isoform X3 [Girardinichthys multiradiatus]